MAISSDTSEQRSIRGRGTDREGGFYVFTRAQLEDLNLQFIIFKYLASGLFPPFQLLLPLLSSSAFSPSIYCSFHFPHHPLFAQPTPYIELGYWGLDQRYMMDQTGRCRRTDGKRWRCSKEVIPNEKYCEKHMHRGCQRSRKLVESSYGKAMSSNHAGKVLNLNLVDCSRPDLNTSKPPRNLKLKMQSSSDVSTSESNKMKDNDGKNDKIEGSDCTRGKEGSTKIVFKPASSAFTNRKMDIEMDIEKRYKVGKDNGCGHEREKDEKIAVDEKLSRAGNDEKCSYGNVKVEKVRTETSDKHTKRDVISLNFSPKSVLRDGHSFSTSDQKNTQSIVADALEPWRCRRTDGKRWRCSKEVIAKDQKYCAKHMHRGAKKRLVTSQDAECGNKINPFALVKRANKLVVGFDSNISS